MAGEQEEQPSSSAAAAGEQNSAADAEAKEAAEDASRGVQELLDALSIQRVQDRGPGGGAAGGKRHAFWETQPVAQFDELQPKEEVRVVQWIRM